MRWLHTVAVACLLHLAAPAEYLLPGDVVPLHYDVKYAFDIDPATNFSFYGIVDILVSTNLFYKVLAGLTDAVLSDA